MRWCLVFPIKGTKFSEPTHNCASGLDAILTASTTDREFAQLNFFYNTQLKRHTVISSCAFYIIVSFFYNNDFFLYRYFSSGLNIYKKRPDYGMVFWYFILWTKAQGIWLVSIIHCPPLIPVYLHGSGFHRNRVLHFHNML